MQFYNFSIKMNKSDVNMTYLTILNQVCIYLKKIDVILQFLMKMNKFDVNILNFKISH